MILMLISLAALGTAVLAALAEALHAGLTVLAARLRSEDDALDRVPAPPAPARRAAANAGRAATAEAL